jgi:hypothetical protein
LEATLARAVSGEPGLAMQSGAWITALKNNTNIVSTGSYEPVLL